MSTQATPDLEGYEEWMRNFLSQLSPEERIAGLRPEDIFPRFKPEERLVDLVPAQAVLALPPELLRALSPEFLATLPEDVQATVRARLRR